MGVDQYRDDTIRSLRFITTELRAAAEALEAAGYQEAKVLEAGALHAQAIEEEIEDFVRDAAPGDHLLLLLSGHGFHSDGLDYLVTGPAQRRSLRFESHCLRIEFGSFLRKSRAAQLVVAVDACRDPIDRFTKSMSDVLDWSKGATGYEDHDTSGPRYAHVYACARYETAGFGYADEPVAERRAPVPDETTGFSYFTKALTELARDPSAPRTLDELEPLLDERVRTIARDDRGRSGQRVQINFTTGRDGLLLFPHHGVQGEGQAEEHRWQKAAAEHDAWQRIRPEKLTEAEKEAAVAQVRDAVVRLVGLWGRDTDRADTWLAEHGDVWRPAECESRMGRCVQTMLRGAAGPSPDLGLTEAALLVLGPFLYTAFGTWLAHQARDIRPWTLADGPLPGNHPATAARGDFERYCGAHQALRDRERRARERGRDDEARAVAWWLARQWLLRLPGTREDVRRSGLAGLERLPDTEEFAPPLVREALSPGRLCRLAGLIGLDLEQAPPPEPDTVAAQHAAEHTVDWERVGTLLTVAHHMAVDPVLLSSLVAEHLGISDPVVGTEFRAALRGLTWQPEAPRRVLSVKCPHQAVELALREHTEALDRTVRAVLGRPDGDRVAAWGVPAGFGAGSVTPATRDDGKPRYEAADVRFRLDGDRVRDLLMGEQLYRDRTLALRELYQNALDACRYRKARTELWNLHHPDEPADWQGRIVFTQGVEDGRPYIECHDNGIGMGRRELRRLFSFAGSRFVEEREFLAEWAEWERAGIPFHPNSRFGVGVLSYFMLADEIRVTTSRLGDDMRTGERLVVRIDGPGALFRIESDWHMLQSGTKVRLYLRNPEETISCGAVLRRNLWVSDFSVQVREEGKELLQWEPGRLSAHVGPDSSRGTAHGAWASTDEDGPVAAQDAGDGVWWCPGGGAVLADGLWAGESRFGAVINLTGKQAPTLSLDRTVMLDEHEEYVAGLLIRKIPVLFDEGAPVLSLRWLRALVLGGWTDDDWPGDGTSSFGRQGPLADRIAEEAVARGHRFTFRTHRGEEITADAAVVGCCPADQTLADRLGTTGTVEVITARYSFLHEWRARAWAAADPAAGVHTRSPILARPTDEVLLQPYVPRKPLPPGLLLKVVEESGLAFADVLERLSAFGVVLPGQTALRVLAEAAAERTAVSAHRLMRLLSRDGDGRAPWRDLGSEFPDHRLSAHGVGRRALADLLESLGFRVSRGELNGSRSRPWPPDPGSLPTRVLREGLEPDGAELCRDRLVPKVHLALAAAAFPGQSDRITEALVAAGYRLPPEPAPTGADPVVLDLLSWYSVGGPRWRTDGPVPLHHLLRVFRRHFLSPEELRGKLVALDIAQPELPPEDDLQFLTRLVEDIHNEHLRHSMGQTPFSPSAVVSLARKHQVPEQEMARRLGELGYEVYALDEHPARPVDHTDLMLLSRDYNGIEPWLDRERPVPWHHVVRAAHDLRMPPDDIVARLSRYGYKAMPEPAPENWRRGEEVALLCKDMAKGIALPSWLPAGRPVPLTHILRTAHALSRTPAAVARRLQQHGHILPGDVQFTEPATP
ncbi:wHTH domain-containing protein [Streptomyces sp. NPDC001135]